MEILSINAENKLARIAASIGRDSRSWSDWLCLVIDLNNINPDMRQDTLIWVKSIMDSYLHKVEGRIFFCNDDKIHVLCRDVSMEVLMQAAQQIMDLIYVENAQHADFKIYNISNEGYEYALKVLESEANHGNPYSAPSVLDGLMEQTFEDLNLKDTAKKILNHQDYIKVMLVEDDPVTRWMVRNALKHQCRFATASCANKAFSLLSSYEPDIVFLDINLPDKSGYDVLEWIMRHDPGACVVMFSSQNNMDNIASALEAGAKGFITKPFLKENLMHYIHNFTSMERAR
jgi:CheY-like chemotaxis protein